jgi:hypothetical protein
VPRKRDWLPELALILLVLLGGLAMCVLVFVRQ